MASHDRTGVPISRARMLKLIAATGGAAAASTLVPAAWSKPIVGIGVLPAHAQVTCSGDLCAIAVTTTIVQGETGAGYGNFDFSMCTPNGHYIWAGSSGDGADSGPSNTSFDPPRDNESVHIGTAIPGTYSLYLEHYASVPLDMTVEITTEAGTFNASFALTASRAVADVVFPGGVLTWRSDETYPECWGGNGDAAAAKRQ